MRRFVHLTLLIALLTGAARAETMAVTEDLRLRAVGILRENLATAEEWVKVHAAEFLLELGYTDKVYDTFDAERTKHSGTPQYRIGIWRVLAKASPAPAEYQHWVDQIRGALQDPNGPDRLHATETLSKLPYRATPEEQEILKTFASSDDGPLAAFASCMLVHAGLRDYEHQLRTLLLSEDDRTRQCAAYALRHVDSIAPQTWDRISEVARLEPVGTLARVYLHAAASFHAPDATEHRAVVLDYARTGKKNEQYEASAVLAARGTAADLPLLVELLEDDDMDVRSGAAYAVLRIGRRAPHGLHPLDWTAIAGYIALMLGVGVYYARRSRTSEEYHLGGRRMNPLTVGLSLFATLMSTLTYLALPGEMIKHGPMIVSQYLVFPFIFLMIGFVVIPRIMKQKVTSAYEILELRLGMSARLMGSLFFLSLRFMWMALIIYATSSKVLVPILNLDPAMTPVLCTLLGVVTIAYTSLGGLRAVVVTDVMQTFILFGGAVLTLMLITVKMGGVAAWFPDAWSPHWQPFKFWYDPTMRITVAGAMTSAFVWHVCTSLSDQVAIQRYLSTRDTRAARRVIATSLTTDAMTGIFLATLGIALWSYFQATPQLLPDNYQSLQNADTLFPRFISRVLPVGISGLVIAGLLAAAMSSLSSGVNSASLVISVDFLDRFRKGTATKEEPQHVREARIVTVLVGIVVIVLSIAAGLVGGNLLEIVYKVANLFVAPLAILFIMALFMPWATAPAAILASACSLAMAAAIAYGDFLGLSFIWIMPMALVTGMIIGPLASLVLGKK